MVTVSTVNMQCFEHPIYKKDIHIKICITWNTKSVIYMNIYGITKQRSSTKRGDLTKPVIHFK